jgi:hypothetical protein
MRFRLGRLRPGGEATTYLSAAGNGGRASAVFDAEWECSQSGHYFRANFRPGGEDAMRIFGLLGIGFLIWLAPAPMAVTVAETVLQAPDATSPPHPASVEEDLLNLED